MLLIANVKNERRKPLPENYEQLSLWEKLYCERSDIQSVTHLDFSARLQTVHKETNLKFHALITKFKEKTNFGLLINTSFNVRGEPPVCSPEDAYKCFMNTELDYLVMENYIFKKTDQPDWDNKNKWKENFMPD
jgi:carbamoyltransferase